jgi:hypothetical protein
LSAQQLVAALHKRLGPDIFLLIFTDLFWNNVAVRSWNSGLFA